ncbi:amino acid transporter tat1 [Parelaphostrongylus tenuis]|uniref:Amino acid transporter tat1 n=1 Tax=Parelaphostrongylus tenuis TaxID=148309 RepID=A0AAD5N8L8_PARTN|nr:amino acid transporter tat1 [Parelaphostrongylus tenuis]
MLECDSWTWPVVISCVASFFLWLLFLCIYSAVFPLISTRIGDSMAGMAWIMMSSYLFWMALLFIPLATLLWDLVIKSIFTITTPTPREQAVLSLKKSGTTSGFERLASKSSRNAVARMFSQPSDSSPPSRSLEEKAYLRGLDNPVMEYGSTEMIALGQTNSNGGNVTRIVINGNDVLHERL